MTSTSISPDFVAVLEQAALAFQNSEVSRPDAEQVVEALLQAEKSAKQTAIDYQFSQLEGEWRLCFATGTRKIRQGGIKLKKGYYVPKIAKAQLSFSLDESGSERIGNLAQVGLLTLKFSGPARYQTKKNLLAFDFTQLQVCLGEKTFYSQPVRGGAEKERAFSETSIAKLPFFAFFLIGDRFVAARGRGGGLALWVKNDRLSGKTG
ncbi:MAG: hypothetical protein KME18_07170 [Phormidium tanganyikae FI6-MK23]|jgi:hypothetical protein|nr:hypothetical protein [Phormidium tanganyikae FI6-MK23]